MLGFLGEAIRNYRQTGAVAPSSRALACSMVSKLTQFERPRRILEVGSGTGAFTRRILEQMAPGDQLDAVEINAPFADTLDKSILEPHRAANPEHVVRVHACAIEDAALEGPYHVVVCGLPFNNFPLEMTKRIFSIMLGSMEPGGWLSYFEYLAMRPMKAPFVGRGGRATLEAHGNYLGDLEGRLNGQRRLIVGNIPPAWSVHLQATATG